MASEMEVHQMMAEAMDRMTNGARRAGNPFAIYHFRRLIDQAMVEAHVLGWELQEHAAPSRNGATPHG